MTLKLVQVYVTDKEGRPVTDLSPADFELFDNGKRVTITDFEKHISVASTKPEKEKEAALRTAPPKLSRKFFLFFDFVFNNPRGLEQAKRAALHFLDTQLQPSDEIGVISYSLHKGLTLHEYLTTDHQKAKEVIEGFSQEKLLGRAHNLEAEYWNAMKDFIGEPHATVPKTKRDGIYDPAKHKLRELSLDRMIYQLSVRNFTQKMGDLAKSLRIVPGYKYIILFSSGIAGSIFQGAPEALDRSKLVSGQTAGATPYNVDSLYVALWEAKRYENMIKNLAQANCPVFVLNTEELSQDPSFKKAMSGEYPLKKISEISGGKYFPHVENYESNLAQVQNMTGSYYVLGYSIGTKEDGKFHEIKVRVRRKGCEVHAQGGYFNPKRFAEYTELEKTLHLLDLALSENPQLQAPVEFPMMAIACPGDKGTLVFMLSEIPREKSPSAGKGLNEVVTLIFDSQKNIVHFKRVQIDFSAIAESAICCSMIFSLPPGDYDCRMILRNLETGQSAVARETVHVPEAQHNPLTLLPPLLLRRRGPMREAVTATGPDSKAPADVLSLTAFYPFNPEEYSPFLGELRGDPTKVEAMIVCGLKDIPEPDLELTFVLKEEATGKEAPLPHSVLLAKQHGREGSKTRWLTVLCQLELPDLKPGRYVLRALAKETATLFEAESHQKLRVRQPGR